MSGSATCFALSLLRLLLSEPVLDLQKALTMLRHAGGVLDAATVEERWTLLRKFFDAFWLAPHALNAVTPTRLYINLIGVTTRNNSCRSSLGTKPRQQERCIPGDHLPRS